MSGPALEGIPRAAWEAARAAPHRLLMLDYDGTLAPFHAIRSEAVPPPDTLRLLHRLARRGDTTVAIVSGRPAREVEALLGPLDVTIVGEHGWERRDPGGARVEHHPPAAVARALARAAHAAEARGWGSHLERKRASIVLHVRGLPEDEAGRMARECEAMWSGAARTPGLRLSPVHGGLELRAAARDKGTAARELIARCAPGTLAVYAGDDATDEDAFAVVRDTGIGIRVGADTRASLAGARLPGVPDVTAFLARWLEIVAGEPAGGA